MDNYISNADIVDTKGLSTAEIDTIIQMVSRQVEFYCQDIFQPIDLIRIVDGSGAKNLFPPTGYNDIRRLDIVSISKVEYRDENNVYTEVLATDYRYNHSKLMLLGDGWWAMGKMNYRLTMQIGHGVNDWEGNPDQRYFHQGALWVVKKLVLNILDTHYGTVQGTASMEASEGPYKSESIGSGDYSYSILSGLSNLESKSPTGFADVDAILVSLARRRPSVRVLSPNPQGLDKRKW